VSVTGKLAIIGAGIGGLALAGFLSRQGVKLTLYEQARNFQRIGAGIQMSPNAVRVLRALGLEPLVRQIAFAPRSWSNRVWDSGAPLFDLTFGPEAETRYGAPYLLMHRGDLHGALLSTVPAGLLAYDKTLVGIERIGGSFTLRFADGGSARADAVIGADGVHSRVREILLGPEKPRFTGRIAHRTTFPSALMKGYLVETCTKWWGPDRHIVIYPVDPRRDETYFVTSVPDPTWNVESWSARGDMAEVRRAFAGFHDDVQRVLAHCPTVHKWALFERDPLPRWTDGAVALLGDACHPMTPYMAQGAATALEDAAMIARCLDASPDPAEAFHRYEAVRHERTARIQLTSRQNNWGKSRVDPSWVYGYDVFQASLSRWSVR
jgi:salicylate hydroxylase/6-hydroxynicotinate 3-monooxygenase